jgi:hypothetical protein
MPLTCAKEDTQNEFGPLEKRTGIFYLSTLDYSRNNEAKAVPSATETTYCGGSKREPHRWETFKMQEIQKLLFLTEDRHFSERRCLW